MTFWSASIVMFSPMFAGGRLSPQGRRNLRRIATSDPTLAHGRSAALWFTCACSEQGSCCFISLKLACSFWLDRRLALCCFTAASFRTSPSNRNFFTTENTEGTEIRNWCTTGTPRHSENWIPKLLAVKFALVVQVRSVSALRSLLSLCLGASVVNQKK